MITSALLQIILFAINLLVLPITGLDDVVLDSNISSALSTASGYLHALDQILPVSTILAILAIALAIEGSYLIYKLIMWVIKKIPTIN